MTDGLLYLGLAAAIILSLTATAIALFCAYSVAPQRDLLENASDKADRALTIVEGVLIEVDDALEPIREFIDTFEDALEAEAEDDVDTDMAIPVITDVGERTPTSVFVVGPATAPVAVTRPRPSPVPRADPLAPLPDRTDTNESDMARQIEQVKLEAERDPVAVEWREFTRADGSVVRFQVKKAET